jgi:hypothetical protein
MSGGMDWPPSVNEDVPVSEAGFDSRDSSARDSFRGSTDLGSGGLVLVVAGSHAIGEWELRGGPHSLPQDARAVEHQLVAEYSEWRGGSTYGGVGARVTDEQLAIVGRSVKGLPGAEIGFIHARCTAAVSTVVVQWDHGVEERIGTTMSPSTGEGWLVCPFDTARVPRRLCFLDDVGRTLMNHEIDDPRNAHPGQ